MECSACNFSLSPPPERATEAAEPTGIHHPRWEEDIRLDTDWARYARPGSLTETWGAPGPLERVKTGNGAPSYWAAIGRRGRADDDLDAVRRADADDVEGLADALRSLMAIAVRARATRAAPTKTKADTGLLTVLLGHCDEAAGQPATNARQAVTDVADLDPQPWLLDALALLLANALIRRNVDVWDLVSRKGGRRRGGEGEGGAIRATGDGADVLLEPIAPRLPRSTPFAGLKHALAVAFGGEAVLSGRAFSPGGAAALHALPQGMQFNRIACKPSRSGGGRAPGEDAVLDAVDVKAALAGCADLDVLRLMDYGVDKGKARQTKAGVMIESVEQLDAGEVVSAMRRAGREGVTEHQVRKARTRARGDAVDSLVAHGLIPKPKRRAAQRPKQDPFAGITPGAM